MRSPVYCFLVGDIVNKTYYVDNLCGSKSGDGLTPETAALSYKDVPVRPGDTVLFRRGCTFSESITSPDGEEGKPITYSAYGEGEKPQFEASLDLSDASLWVSGGNNIWEFAKEIKEEVCNLFLDDGFGWLCFEKEELKREGNWYYTHIGYTNRECPESEKSKKRILYLYCDKNPAEKYGKIKASLFGARYLASANESAIFDNLSFKYSGVHGFLGIGAKNITIKNCDFTCIGGAVWQRDRKIRFGNGVEFWNYAENITVENCTFDNIYDSCTTHQGGRNYETPKNITIRNNRFSNYGMAAYEIRDKVPFNTDFSGNVCENAGVGISVQSEERPRNSEIYPEPLGHHIFIWRIEKITDGGSITIADNTFGKADFGSAIYSIIPHLEKGQFLFKSNTFPEDYPELIKWENEYISLENFKKLF